MIDPEFPEPESSATDIRYRLHVDDITRRKANETRTRLGVTGRGRPADVARCDTLTHEENKALDIQTIQRDGPPCRATGWSRLMKWR